jgi:mRNA interferase YafQ
MLELIQTSTFKKSLKRYKHNKVVLQELSFVVELLINEKSLPEKYHNHKLTGNFSGMMELHLKPDDLLVYFKIEKESITLVAIGSHSDLFG